MDVIIDGQRQPIDSSECANLAELVVLAERGQSSREQSVVVAVSLDGEALPPEALGELEEHGLEGIGRVEIQRRSAEAVARSVLEQGSEYAGRVVAAIERTVGHFRGGRSDQGNALLADVSDSLTVLTGITGSVSVALPGVVAALTEVQNDLFPWLEAMVEAQTEQDPLGIADLLEYEVRDRVEHWGSVLQACAKSEGAVVCPPTSTDVSN